MAPSNLAGNDSDFAPAQENNDFIIHPCVQIKNDNTDITNNIVQTNVLFNSDSPPAQENNDFIIHPCDQIKSDNTDITNNSDIVQTNVQFDSDSNLEKK